MTANKIRLGSLVYEAQKNGDVVVGSNRTLPHTVVSHLDTIRLSYWLARQYLAAAARRADGGRRP